MIRIKEKRPRVQVTEEGIKGFAGGIFKQVDPAADVHEMAGMTLQQRANLPGQMAIAPPDPFLAATAAQEGRAHPDILG